MTHLDRNHHMGQGEFAILHANNRPLCIWGGNHVSKPSRRGNQDDVALIHEEW